MKMQAMRVRTALVCAVGALVWGAPALAQATDVESLREALAKQEETLAAQQKMIDEQRLELSRQKAALDTVLGSQQQASPLDLLSAYRAGQAQPQPVSSASASGSADADPEQIRTSVMSLKAGIRRTMPDLLTGLGGIIGESILVSSG